MTAQLPELATALRDRPAQRVQWLPFSIPAGNVSAGTAAPGDAGASHQAAGRRKPEREG